MVGCGRKSKPNRQDCTPRPKMKGKDEIQRSINTHTKYVPQLKCLHTHTKLTDTWSHQKMYSTKTTSFHLTYGAPILIKVKIMKSLVYHYKLYKGKNSITLGPYFWLPGTMLCLSMVRLFPEKLFQRPLGSFVCFQWYDKISMCELTQTSEAYHWYMLTISLRIFSHFIYNNIYKTAEHRQMKCVFVSLHLVHKTN